MAAVLKAAMREVATAAVETVAWRVDVVVVMEVAVMEVDTEAAMAVTVEVTVEAVTVEAVMALQKIWIRLRGQLRPRR